MPPQPIGPRDPEGLEFYHIRGRLCMACRQTNSSWAQNTPPDQWASKVRDETRLKMHVLVPIVGNATLDDVLETAKSLENQKLPAAGIHFIINNDNVKATELTSRLRKMGPSLVWNVRVIVERDRYYKTERVGVGRCIDIVADGLDLKNSNYYSVFYPGYKIPDTFISDVDAALNERLERFVLLRGNLNMVGVKSGDMNFHLEQYNGTVVQTKLHQMLGGNREATHETEDGQTISADDIESKIMIMVRDDKVEYLVKNVGDVCQKLA